MTGRQSSATERALQFLAQGDSIRVAAKKAGVAPSTVWRAKMRMRERDVELELKTGETHVNGWPLYSGLPDGA